MADVVCLVWKCVLFGLVSPERIEVATFNNLDSAHKTEHHPALRQQTRETRRGVDHSARNNKKKKNGVFALCALQLVESHIDIELHFISTLTLPLQLQQPQHQPADCQLLDVLHQ